MFVENRRENRRYLDSLMTFSVRDMITISYNASPVPGLHYQFFWRGEKKMEEKS